MDFSGGNADFSTGIFIGAFKPEASIKFSFVPNPKKNSWTFTEKAGLGCSYSGNKIDISAKGNVNLEQKNGQTKRNISIDIGLKLKLNWFSLKVDVEIGM